MQGQETKKGEKPKYANPADCAVQILKEEGPGGFFMGLIPQVSVCRKDFPLLVATRQSLLVIQHSVWVKTKLCSSCL